MTLVELFKKGGYKTYPTDKGTIHSYLEVYDKLFAPFQNKKINIFEAGYYKGGSCKLWEDYFPKARIRSIDITLKHNKVTFKSDRVKVEAKDIRSLKKYYFNGFTLDIAIDDGSHTLWDQIWFISITYPMLRVGGLIVVEDVVEIEGLSGYLKQSKISYRVIDLQDKKGRGDDILVIIEK